MRLDVDRFQELDLNVSAYVFSESSQEEKWMNKVTATLCEKANYRLVCVPTDSHFSILVLLLKVE